MTNPLDHNEEEAPLDPAVARVQQRLQRLMLIAGLTLGVGILAVLGAIVYRLFTYEPQRGPLSVAEGTAVPTLTKSELGVSAEAKLLATSLDGSHLLLTYDESGVVVAVVFDLDAMAVVRRLRITPD